MTTIRNFLGRLFLPTLFLSAIFCCLSAVSAQTILPKIKAGKIYKQSGVTITSPKQPDWQIVKAEKLETVFVKTTADGKYNAFAKTMTIDVYENVKDLFENLEKLKQKQLNLQNRDSLHFYNTDFKETPCLKYDGIFNNEANYKYFNFNGYLCRHPTAKNILIQVEFSNYSNTRGYSEADIKLSNNFFEKFKFSKIK